MSNPLRELSLAELRHRTSMKWRRYPPDVLPLWVAEMDVALARPVVQALSEAIALGDTGYPEGTRYAEALAEFAIARWSWTVDIDRTAIVPDVMAGIVQILKLVTGNGDAVVVNPPVYPPFYQFIEHMDRRTVEAPLSAEHRIDLTSLEEAFTRATAEHRPAAYLLCSPHNPTGTVHTRDELTAVADLAARYGVRVVVDEVHAPIVYPDASHIPYLSLPGTEDAFTVLSASKAWNLAALKSALVVAGQGAATDLATLPAEVSDSASHVGVIAQCAALKHGSAWLRSLLTGLDENRHLLGDLVAKHLPTIGYRQPQGTYLAWLDCRALNLPDDPADVFLNRGRVALNSGSTFGTGGAGHVRLNLATSPELLTEAVRRMAFAVRAS